MPGPLQYGDGIKALTIDLLDAQMQSLRRCTELVQAMTGIKMSQATCLGYIDRLYDSLEPWEADAREHLVWKFFCQPRFSVHVFPSIDVSIESAGLNDSIG